MNAANLTAFDYGIPRAKRLARELGGRITLDHTRRETPRSGRAYSVQVYRIELPGIAPVFFDRWSVRMLSSNTTAAELRQHILNIRGLS